MGGEIAIRTAAVMKCVKALIIVDFSPGISFAATQHAAEKFAGMFREYASLSEFDERLLSWRTLATPEQARYIAMNALRRTNEDRFVLKCDPRLSGDRDAQSTNSDLSSVLQLIECPTMIVRGAGSALVSRAAMRQMAELVRGSQVSEIRSAGHDVVLDNPEGFLEAVRPFILKYGGATEVDNGSAGIEESPLSLKGAERERI
jgi:pimeloyl-ACP methyl ester carboxylesterase